MASSSPPLPSKDSLQATLDYFAQYDYPLTADELWFWQHGTTFSKSKILSLSNGFKIPNWKIRNRRYRWSQPKWQIARRVGESLKRIPTIQAIFVTGALAMNNCPEDDDIDLMIITSPNTLWLTRLLVYLKIHSLRRKPNTNHAPNLVCDNLYLDTNNLVVHEHSIYTAHEILQAKCTYNRPNIHYQFLLQNSWVKNYLPVAYAESIKKFNNLDLNKNFKFKIKNLLLWPLNLLLFALQYLYMLPKMTTEGVGLGHAFFHTNLKSINKL